MMKLLILRLLIVAVFFAIIMHIAGEAIFNLSDLIAGREVQLKSIQ
jgi:hypothetical protein